MFPQVVKEWRKRDGRTVEIDVFKGQFFWRDNDGHVVRKDSFFEPPTDVRPLEGRIARVHEYACFDTSLVPKGGMGNRVLLLLIQLHDGSVWPFYAEERTLRARGMWDPTVAKELLTCIDAKRPSSRAVIGYKDFTNGYKYCDGK
jgi:hypothetical protein